MRLTDADRQVLEIARSAEERIGHRPSIDLITAYRCGSSKAATTKIVRRLAEAGLLDREYLTDGW